MAARLSDAEWMRRYVTRAGSQRAVGRALGISASMVGLIVRGQRSGERYRDAARAGATGRRVTAPAPTSRTPRRVRRPVRVPTRGGGSRVMTKSPRLAGREVERTVSAGRSVQGLVVTGTFLRITDTAARHRGGVWNQPLTIAQPSDDQLAALVEGDYDSLLVALKEEYPWLEGGTVDSITFTD